MSGVVDGGPWTPDETTVSADGYIEAGVAHLSTATFGPTVDGLVNSHTSEWAKRRKIVKDVAGWHYARKLGI